MAGRLTNPMGRLVGAACGAAILFAMPGQSGGTALGQCLVWADRSGAVGGGNGNRPSPGPMNPMTYDSARGVTVAVDSFLPSDDSVCPVFELGGSNWARRLAAGPELDGPRFGFSLTYDAARARTVFFGGYKGIGGAARATNTLALWNGVSWQVVPPSGAWPPANGEAISVYDPTRRRVIVLVADPVVRSTYQTWEWLGAAWERGPNLAGISGVGTGMVFDTRRNKAFVSGTGDPDDLQAVWELTPGATAGQGVWNRVTVTGDPFEGSLAEGLVYDPFRGSIRRIGGRGLSSIYSYRNSVYLWDQPASRWRVEDAAPFGVRGGAGVAYDTTRDRLVMYGGARVYVENGTLVRFQEYGDTWEFADASPGFINSPSSTSVDGGGTGIFAAATIGEGLSLQWFKDGVPVPGATSALLGVPNASAASQGWYWLRASNACGTRDSVAGYLTVRAPANDTVAGAAPIYSVRVTGTTLGATNDGTATCGASSASPDAWHSYTAPSDGNLTIDTCGSDFDTVLSLSQCCSGAGTVIGCNDDAAVPGAGCGGTTSSLSLAVVRGQRMLVRVAGYQGAVGRYVLNTRLVPFNDLCQNATEVFAGQAAGTTVGGARDGTTTCGQGGTGPDAWYRFRSDCSGTLNLSTEGSGFDTVLSVHAGCPGTVANTLACNDDVIGGITYSVLGVGVAPGGDYRIRVSGYNGASGAIVLRVTPPAPAGDACETAPAIGLGQTAIGTRCAASEGLAGPPWCEDVIGTAGGTPQYDRWFRYEVSQPGILEVRLCDTTFSPIVAVYGASCPESAYQAVACSARGDSCGDRAMVELATLPGEVYLIRVGGTYGLNNIAGTGTIELSVVPYEVGACCAGGACTLAAAYACDGVFRGEGSVCDASACPSPAGACCVGSSCVVLPPGPCAAAGGGAGVFVGAGVACATPGMVLTACCRADFDASGTRTVGDIFAFLSGWFTRDPRCDVDATPGVGVGDIFAFLSLWFAGCG